MIIELNKPVKTLLILEEAMIFIGAVILFALASDYSWWLFALLFFAPDISFAGYAINTWAGSVIYNLFHHKGIMVLLILSGYFLDIEALLATGTIFLAHTSFDRIFGYGLKFSDHFKHTHLGWLGSPSGMKEKS